MCHGVLENDAQSIFDVFSITDFLTNRENELGRCARFMQCVIIFFGRRLTMPCFTRSKARAVRRRRRARHIELERRRMERWILRRELGENSIIPNPCQWREAHTR